jgi:hypothetical protein
MILGYVGNIGSGKTLSMVKKAYEQYKRGKTIYSNFKLNFPYIPITLEKLLDMKADNTSLLNSVLLIDEAHIYLDSRRSASKVNVILSYLILQSRKMSCDIYYTTQFIGQVDKRLRDTSHAYILCKTREIRKGLNITLNIINLRKVEGDEQKLQSFISNNYYDLYDTNEIISD